MSRKLFPIVLLIVCLVGSAYAQIEVAGKLLVNLSAADPSAGTATWVNQGTLGDFTYVSSPNDLPEGSKPMTPDANGPAVEEFEGVPVVHITSDKTHLQAYQGPNAPATIIGSDDRSIEIWAGDLNADLQKDKCLIAWGLRGNDGTNMSVNLGYKSFGALGLYGDDYDTGFGEPQPTTGTLHYLVYVIDSNNTATIYVDGVLSNVRAFAGTLATPEAPINLFIQNQLDAAKTNIVRSDNGLANNHVVNSIRVHSGALTAEQVMNNYEVGPDKVVVWDFENGNDDGFTLWSVVPPIDDPNVTADDPNTAGDEALTAGLPDAGLAWTIGTPNQFDGLIPVEPEGCHADTGVLQYGPCNNPFGVTGEPPYDFTNGRGQSGYLNTYALNQWGDHLNAAANDQIATSRPVMLDANAVLTVWSVGGSTAGWAGSKMAPELDPDPNQGYVDGSYGIAVLSADDGSLLTSLFTPAEGVGPGNIPDEFSLDLSAFAGQKVIIEAVDAAAGGWGFIAIDEIRIKNAIDPAAAVAYYPLDEGSGGVVADASGNGHDGLILGDPNNCWVEGITGTALQFGTAGCDGVDCNMWNPSADTNELSISCWVKFQTGGTKYQGIVANRTGYDRPLNHWALECNGENGGVYFGSRNGSAYGLGLTMPEGEWANIALTFDGTTAVAYLNGVQTGTGTAKFGDDMNSTVRIGASEATSNSFEGAIDDVRLFGVVLTPAEVAAMASL